MPFGGVGVAQAGYFYDPRHKRIFQAIQVMNMEERPVDIMTLADQLAKTGELDKVGGAQYLMDISAAWLRLPM